MSVAAIFLNPNNPNNWRPCERESMERHFGYIYEFALASNYADYCPCETIFWRLDAEKTPEHLWLSACDAAEKFEKAGQHQINDPRGWLGAHAKDLCFVGWKRQGIPIPKWLSFKHQDQLFAALGRMIDYPFLFRINDGNTGEASWLVENELDLENAIEACPAAWARMAERYGEGVERYWMGVEFIENLYEGYRYSYRIIVAGNKVITGYARMCRPPDWIAITNRFETEMGEVFIELQKRCQRFCEQQEGLLVEAVRCLGLNWQGVDVIERPDGTPVFLEVQPDFSCGNERSGDVGPWYNPSYPPLVKFIKDNEARFRAECPMYYERWLPKAVLFDLCHKALKEPLE